MSSAAVSAPAKSRVSGSSLSRQNQRANLQRGLPTSMRQKRMTHRRKSKLASVTTYAIPCCPFLHCADTADKLTASLQRVDNYEYELPSDFEDEEIDEEGAFTEADKKQFADWFGNDAAAGALNCPFGDSLYSQGEALQYQLLIHGLQMMQHLLRMQVSMTCSTVKANRAMKRSSTQMTTLRT